MAHIEENEYLTAYVLETSYDGLTERMYFINKALAEEEAKLQLDSGQINRDWHIRITNITVFTS
jgi:hypothetical protein